jgi:class 3 adenylate cyclase
MGLTALKILQGAVSIAFWTAIGIFLILFGLQFQHPPQLDDVWLVSLIHSTGDPWITRTGSLFGLAWPSPGSKSLLPLGTCAATWGIKVLLDEVFRQLNRLLKPAEKPKLITAEGLAEVGGADSEKARTKLLKQYQEIEKALKAAKRKRCTFLSVDVVGSTQMKVGKDLDTEVRPTFHAYEEMLRMIFDDHAAWKQAWTPDGVMVCFLDLDLAVGAARKILLALQKFNESENKLDTPFRVRAGLNVGEVPIFEDSKLEKIADHVIDVAGHMQKHGAPDTLWLSGEVYNGLKDKNGFHPVEAIVDGYKVYEWRPDSA